MKPLKKNPTVTIGITAWNEGSNIVRLLTSILKQHQTTYRIKKILVISDGSTDDTAAQAKSVFHPHLQVVTGRQNRGYVARRNQLIQSADTDILITLDADEELIDPQALAKMISEFYHHPQVALVSGNPFFAQTNSFIMRCQLASFQLYDQLRYQINQGHNIYGCSGGMMALRKEFYSQLHIPLDVLADDSYTYLNCISQGYRFRNARTARIAHYVHSDLRSHMKRNRRYARTADDLRKYYGGIVDQENYIPKQLFLTQACKTFITNPIYTVCIFIINKYSTTFTSQQFLKI